MEYVDSQLIAVRDRMSEARASPDSSMTDVLHSARYCAPPRHRYACAVWWQSASDSTLRHLWGAASLGSWGLKEVLKAAKVKACWTLLAVVVEVGALHKSTYDRDVFTQIILESGVTAAFALVRIKTFCGIQV